MTRGELVLGRNDLLPDKMPRFAASDLGLHCLPNKKHAQGEFSPYIALYMV